MIRIKKTGNLNKGGSLTWTVRIKEKGAYCIHIQTRGAGRNVWQITTDEEKTVQNQQGSSSIFTDAPIGWISFDSPGLHTLTIRQIEGEQVELAGISIMPVCLK